ncbi:MFS transporter [Blautia wexlerae]|nr:MFS transporter [Blautia wexlerae]
MYAIIPDCVEYGEWKTGLRNDGFQYAFVSLGNKIGMAIGTALLAKHFLENMDMWQIRYRIRLSSVL